MAMLNINDVLAWAQFLVLFIGGSFAFGKIWSDVKNVKGDVRDVKQDIKDMRNKLDSHIEKSE